MPPTSTPAPTPRPALRRSQVFLALARSMELATGASEDFSLRGLVLSMRLATAAGIAGPGLRAVFDQALLRYIGCNAETHLMSAFVEDEIAFRRDVAAADMKAPAEMLPILLTHLRRRASAPRGVLELLQALSQAADLSQPVLAGHCEVAARLGQRLGLDPEVCSGLGQLYARWDGKGIPAGVAGRAIAPAVRVVMLAQEALVLMDSLGAKAMQARLRRRAGKVHDPDLVTLLLAHAEAWLADLGQPPKAEAALALEPLPHALMGEPALEAAALVLADIADLRLPQTHGHSRGVAQLCDSAAAALHLPADQARALHLAALAHDIGELALPVGAWMRPGGLTRNEADLARQHPRIGARLMESLAPALDPVVTLIAQHHECLDGSGDPRGLRAADLALPARILAAAEVCAATPAALREAIAAGRIDPVAGEAVLAAAGQPSRRAAPPPGLSPREIEVLQAIASGQTTKEAARALGISPKTCDHHIQSLYGKIGTSTRAGAVLWAMERGLAGPT